MTPAEQFQILRRSSDEINAAVERAYIELITILRTTDTAPQVAVQTVMAKLSGEYAAVIAAGLGIILKESMGSASALALNVGPVQLSAKLYAQEQATAAVVQGVIQNHVRGFQDARALALELYEGYGFRPDDPLVISRTAKVLPKYLKELLRDPVLVTEFAKAFAKSQEKALRTSNLQAAYRELLRAIDNIEEDPGREFLEKKLRVAFYEKVRYFADRIARTELQRAYANRRALEIMLDSGVDFVEWRLSPSHPIEDICDYFAGVDYFGLGPGVYPKGSAPVGPAHPFCQCVLVPRTDLTGKTAVYDENAELRFFNSLSQKNQRLVAGSKAKLARIKAGETAWDVHNSKIDPIYQVQNAEQVAENELAISSG